MARQVFLLDPKDPTLAADYDLAHRPGQVPASVLADIGHAGITAMEIYRSGDRLVMIAETPTATSATDRVFCEESVAWKARLDHFQRPLPVAAAEKWYPADRIFDLEHHKKDPTP